ncbi:FAD-dependent oxidoreductase, partial [Priestia megaterium]|uniref:FAD-dependent oxidoreductase n=1 Tax=Priestia megaterium TaxID=1404 RepID=UPI0035B6076B
ELGRLVRDEIEAHGVEVVTGTTVRRIQRSGAGLEVLGDRDGSSVRLTADLVLVVVGVRPNTGLLERAGARLGPGGAV